MILTFILHFRLYYIDHSLGLKHLESEASYKKHARASSFFRGSFSIMQLQRPSHWFISYSFIVTMITATIIILHLLEKYIVHASDTESTSRVSLVPSITIQVDWLDVIILLASSIGIWGITRANRNIIGVYFYFLLSFVGIQLILATAVLENKNKYIEDNLRQSWERAYSIDRHVIFDIQREFHCQGFDDTAEFMVEMSEFFGVLPACKYALIDKFGSKMFSIGIMTMLIRLFQFGGIFLLSIVLRHVDTTEDDEEDLIKSPEIVLLNETLVPLSNEKYDKDSVHLISFNDEEKFKGNDGLQSIVPT
ncbi:hypothetical protein K450DRAFT_113280 [Umbelopsis ramanniana AG]|uniref:Uncharacterized protein n=1 Tax=Umbelopsis ramanniana AG TaxID=1314678 RepID=A0AAD5E3W9_UMBRA|nr:uncharacterized protein K450DRAFT_113280 [Umbelopsis ramanniana AG]KAI8576891.1 hypothetical protein K450DRAFT_113280 [Umbelopsis ramanniana AG]